MYSRPQSRDIRVPINYGGSIFGAEHSTPVKDYTKKRYAPPHVIKYAQQAATQDIEEQNEVDVEAEEKQAFAEQPHIQSASPSRELHETKSIFSPVGALGTEEILLIALALIIFQSGNDPEISLILLALLFIN